MQEWQEQAIKNNLTIIENGECQLCGSKTNNGILECVEKSSIIAHKLNHDSGIKYMTIFLCVDAYALQHSEIHGRWNNHFHLTRLNLILNEKIQWSYKLSPILSSVWDSYKIKKSNEIVKTPPVRERGIVVITDVEKANTDIEYVQFVNQWAKGVFASFIHSQTISKRVSELFKEKIFA